MFFKSPKLTALNVGYITDVQSLENGDTQIKFRTFQYTNALHPGGAQTLPKGKEAWLMQVAGVNSLEDLLAKPILLGVDDRMRYKIEETQVANDPRISNHARNYDIVSELREIEAQNQRDLDLF